MQGCDRPERAGLRVSLSGRTERASSRHTAALVTLSAAVLIVQIDSSVVNLATRPIGQFFGADVAALQWVVDAYNLFYAVLLMTGGLLADVYGRRGVYMAGCAIFTAACLLCAAAPGIVMLIGARALAGVGAALMIPSSLALVRVVWPDPVARGRALGVWAACNGVGLAIGPTVGGVLIGQFGWRSIFAVVVPFGLAAVALAVRTLPKSADPTGRHFDALGQLLSIATLGGLVVAAIEAHRAPWIGLAALVTFLLSLAFFVRVETKRGAGALIPMSLFQPRPFRAAVAATAGMTFGMYGVLFLLPLTWQSSGTLDPFGAGLALVPMALVFVLVSPFSGSVAARVGSRLATSGGVAVIGTGLLAIATTASTQSIIGAEFGLVLTGIGMGIASGPLFDVAIGTVPAARSGTASSVINVARMAGATIGVAILGAIFSIAQGGIPGLRIAMIVGGVVQLLGALTAWTLQRPSRA